MFRDVILAMTGPFPLQNKSLSGDDTTAGACRGLSSNSWLKSRTSPISRIGRSSSATDMNVQLGSAGSPTLRLAGVKVNSYKITTNNSATTTLLHSNEAKMNFNPSIVAITVTNFETQSFMYCQPNYTYIYITHVSFN